MGDALPSCGVLPETEDNIADAKNHWETSMDEARQAKEELMKERKWADLAFNRTRPVYFAYY